ncbi:hypothetical protein C4D60_Mb11t12990 [Musa balbisiana]|uniref:Uncharacterized protein n=1 Tax=Musa balbisiana TaxID=52838 RepID=A0A4S8J3T0_MUSBA|nr:hypothetical protein C4D60_Mb11t12990 [Musa balbisiana]
MDKRLAGHGAAEESDFYFEKTLPGSSQFPRTKSWRRWTRGSPDVDMEQLKRAVSFWCIQEQPSQRPSMGKHPGAALAEIDAGRGFGHRQAFGSEGRRWWLGGCH